MLILAIIATIFCIINFGSDIERNKENYDNLTYVLMCSLIDKAFIVTVIWVFYSNLK